MACAGCARRREVLRRVWQAIWVQQRANAAARIGLLGSVWAELARGESVLKEQERDKS